MNEIAQKKLRPSWLFASTVHPQFLAWLESSAAHAVFVRALEAWPEDEYVYLWREAAGLKEA